MSMFNTDDQDVDKIELSEESLETVDDLDLYDEEAAEEELFLLMEDFQELEAYQQSINIKENLYKLSNNKSIVNFFFLDPKNK